MTSQAAIHKRNLDSAILFMQQEHAETLKGLHKEIENLQKKCSGIYIHFSYLLHTLDAFL
jgi:hypothetical protein